MMTHRPQIDPQLDFEPQLQCEANGRRSARCDAVATSVARLHCRSCHAIAVYVICPSHHVRMLRDESPVSFLCPRCHHVDHDPPLDSLTRFTA